MKIRVPEGKNKLKNHSCFTQIDDGKNTHASNTQIKKLGSRSHAHTNKPGGKAEGRKKSPQRSTGQESPKVSTNSLVFNWVLKASTLSKDRRERGSLFHSSGRNTDACLLLNFEFAFRLLNFGYWSLNRSKTAFDRVGLISVPTSATVGTRSRRSAGADSHTIL